MSPPGPRGSSGAGRSEPRILGGRAIHHDRRARREDAHGDSSRAACAARSTRAVAAERPRRVCGGKAGISALGSGLPVLTCTACTPGASGGRVQGASRQHDVAGDAGERDGPAASTAALASRAAASAATPAAAADALARRPALAVQRIGRSRSSLPRIARASGSARAWNPFAGPPRSRSLAPGPRHPPRPLLRRLPDRRSRWPRLPRRGESFHAEVRRGRPSWRAEAASRCPGFRGPRSLHRCRTPGRRPLPPTCRRGCSC
jgi:hypothetical protein